MQLCNQQETPHYESSTLPYVCWYQNDFLGGVRGMRAHEIGIYTILLNEMYARGRPLELSVERLARLCGCDKRTFLNVLEMLIEEGKILNLANGLWNKRCDRVFQERAKLLEKKSFAGRSSAKKRKKINAEIEHLLNRCEKNVPHNLEAQKTEEEKETPNGVSEKPRYLSLLESEAPEKEQPTNASRAHSGCSSPQGEVVGISSPLKETATSPSHLNEDASHFSNFSNKSKTSRPYLKGHRLPADWQADIDAAISEGLHEEQARWQEKKFRDYWHAKSGKEALKVDWQAAWRNWYRREIERIKESTEKARFLSTHGTAAHQNNDNDTLYRSLINYQTG
ncbi:YdaU family protein [Bartonella raoultii]|uniref:YdaU family protein n=1 Tax=Bartonella raoultii TaxID=1457020 RepID=A0ABS7I6F3_9HYPH|nr:DUF1376 domain-containing protein [Bartonella raoultii]MBX4336484.1 YdaU family protein [Bartonella raoultii]